MSRRMRRLAFGGMIVIGLALFMQFAIPAFGQPNQAGNATAASEVGPEALPAIFWLAPVASIAALVAAWLFYLMVTRADPGDEKMREIAQAVRDGAFAYLRRQYWVVGLVFVILVLLLAVQSFVANAQHSLVPFAFLTGGFFSGLAGFFGMNTATKASNRTTQGATSSLNRALIVAFRAGAVMGLVVVGLGLLDISLWFLILTQLWGRVATDVLPWQAMSLDQITVVMLTFGMGASTQALFARVGGGIYTKAADVGADLVGKVEAGIPEDDPRNPATIADNVGDNVGDVAGMGADLYESYCGSILATAALGAAAAAALFRGTGQNLHAQQINFIVLPMALAGVGILLSILSIFFVRTKEGASQKNLLWALRRGVWGSSILILIAAAGLSLMMLPSEVNGHPVAWGIFGSIAAGLLAGVAIGWFTEYYTSAEYKPTQKLSDQALTGPATTIIGGIAGGMLSTWAPLIIISIATLAAYGFAGGFTDAALGLYGIGIAAVGMLATLGVTLATDAYGPIADNAGGNAEMTHKPKEVRERTDALDSLGNTTAATGKGFAIGSAALTALALLAAYVEEVRIGVQREASNAPVVATASLDVGGQRLPAAVELGHGKFAEPTGAIDPETKLRGAFIRVGSSAGGNAQLMAVVDSAGNPVTVDGKPKTVNAVRVKEATLANFMDFYDVNLMNPTVLVGMFVGVMLVMVFCGLTMQAVGRAAGRMVDEVRRQFKEKPGIMAGTDKPDYASCVSIATAGAQREMIVPALLAVAAPVLVGLLLNVSGVIGLLAGGLTAGFAIAVFMANAGGSWDNAKKYIEGGMHGGKGSNPHKAAVVGDTVGDPFKDTSGPSLNILIKLMSMVSVVFAGMTVKIAPMLSDLFSSIFSR